MTQRIAVIGTGTIGASWAAIFLARGLDVAASDPSPEGEAFARRFIANAWPTLDKLGWVASGASPDRFSFHMDPAAAAAGADFVQESGPEREDLKIKLFATIDAAAPPETVIASSSSGLLISRVTVACKHPERCIIGHPFNPPHLIPLVEVVGGARTSPTAIDKAMAFYRAIGKHPIHIKKEVKGHVANRLQAALWREAVSLVADGVVSVAANVAPHLFSRLCEACAHGDTRGAAGLDLRLQDLYALLGAEPNPIPVKWCLAQLGLGEAFVRLPLVEFPDTHHAHGVQVLDRLGLVEPPPAVG